MPQVSVHSPWTVCELFRLNVTAECMARLIKARLPQFSAENMANFTGIFLVMLFTRCVLKVFGLF